MTEPQGSPNEDPLSFGLLPLGHCSEEVSQVWGSVRHFPGLTNHRYYGGMVHAPHGRRGLGHRQAPLPREWAAVVSELKKRPRPRSPSFTTPVAVMNTLAGLMSAGEGETGSCGIRGAEAGGGQGLGEGRVLQVMGTRPSGLLPQNKASALPSCRPLGNSLSFLTDKWV